jgi:hypothetical protein
MQVVLATTNEHEQDESKELTVLISDTNKKAAVAKQLLKVSSIIYMLTLLLMPLAGLHFCVGLDFVTPSL